jgi:hypothetical protein
MLEALAKARRGDFGDDPKMPNPMRARLHEEVRARHGESSTGLAEDEKTESRLSWLGMFWPRLAVVAAVATLLVVAPTIWWQRSHPGGASGLANRESVAVNGTVKPAAPEDALAKGPAAVAAAAPTVNLADNSQVKIEPAATPTSEAQTSDESKRLAEMHLTPVLPDRVTKSLVMS